MSGLCMRCMAPLEGGGACPACGYSGNGASAPHRLAPGTVLVDRYLVGNAIGQGGFGITYIGRDLTLNMRVAVKEYYPTGHANRNVEVSDDVTVADDGQAAFLARGKERFLSEARVLAKFYGNPGVVDVRDFFEANNTAYIIMEHLEGEDLRSHLKWETLTADQAFSMMRPVMDVLEKIHAEGFVHRDISPDNIMLLKDGTLRLMDFGSARMVDYEDQRSVSVILKAGYAPEEQYRSKGVQGPWTDIYALCATIYKCITGVTLEESIQRLHADEIKWPSELGVCITETQEAVLKKGLSPHARDRFRSIAQMREALDKGFPAGREQPQAVSAAVLVAPPDDDGEGATRMMPDLAAPGEDEPATDLLAEPAQAEPPAPAPGERRRRVRGGHLAAAAAVACAVVLAASAGAFASGVLAPVERTVEFDSEGGSPVETLTVVDGEDIAEPAAPTLPNHSFAGWYLDSAHTTKAQFPLHVTGDLGLHAAWESVPVSYTVRYLAKGSGKALKDAKVVDGQPAGSTVTESAPSIEGYEKPSDKKRSLELSQDGAENVITFRYKKKAAPAAPAKASAASRASGTSSSGSSSGSRSKGKPNIDWDDWS